MDTLVLSHAYEPVARCDWQRAITLLFEGKVEIIKEYEDRNVSSVSVTMKVPSVIRFLRMSRPRKRAVKFSRENVYMRDHGRCQYCSRKVTHKEATYDHVIPRSQGGPTNWVNVVISCTPCNQKKGGRTPSQAGMKLLSIPTKPEALHNPPRLTFLFDKDVPVTWKQVLMDYGYWQGELEHD